MQVFQGDVPTCERLGGVEVKALIDGDIVLYGCGFASQHRYYHVFCMSDVSSDLTVEKDEYVARFRYKHDAEVFVGEGLDLFIIPYLEVDPIGIALSNASNYIAKVLKDVAADDYCIYFSDTPLERDGIATIQGYKENRKGAPKPVHYENIKEFVLGNYQCEVILGLEADDGMALDQKQDGSTIICTLDKDLDMVPGLRYRDGKIRTISEREGQLAFYTQLLTGDATDNIPGLFKLTGKKALAHLKARLEDLETDREMYEYVRGVYMDFWPYECGELSDWDVVLLEIGRLLWMRRELDKNWEIPTE